ALTAQMEQNLQQLALSKAEEINLKLTEVMDNTKIASHLAADALNQQTEQSSFNDSISKYQPDQRNIVGLDVFYNEQNGVETIGENLSNVYWPYTLDPSDSIASKIIATEGLDPVFAGIKQVNSDTQWVYLTTVEGMMRLYPWASNDHYPDAWDPREIIFYTVAEPSNNPDLLPQWTPPYVDYAGAGWMVTASVPILEDNNTFLGVMSHDVTIDSLKQIALGINVLDGGGYGFLIDRDGKVIAHPDFQDADASKGTQDETSLLSWGSQDFRLLVQQMVNGQKGLGYYTSGNGESLLVFAPIPETGWSLGISIPQEQVIAPAMETRDRALIVSGILLVAAVILAVFLARLIHRPILQLLEGVQQVTLDRKADEIQVKSFNEFTQLAGAFNDMASRVWERESRLKAKVAELRIEIDTNSKQERLESIMETDFFKRLEQNVNQLRADIKSVAAD
ncbi:MAG TPA: cache domain-containing protein, partial [Cyclobacteriaceae bacterium]|nr:cache domain-containing protein [Cyclobacteriaceae bacterium]